MPPEPRRAGPVPTIFAMGGGGFTMEPGNDAVARGAIPAGWAVDDGAGLLFRGTRLAEVVASRLRARAYRVHVRYLRE